MEPVILYEDAHLVVCCKPVNYLSEDDGSVKCMPRWLREHYHALGKNDYIATVHRLDKVTGGVMVFSTLISLVRQEPIGGKTYLAAGLACLSTILILF